ncbi:aspartic peptidase domain-containing protein [Immersiella caudata]|uniref:Aspartic peptidase domain-containing protein n=1 Tax=Immersiella caudata TaxID=314043 RepID=A0AA39X3K3_9PEZI|nr:aspartic peptidase domain-containing protein [Immersiella caudata]
MAKGLASIAVSLLLSFAFASPHPGDRSTDDVLNTVHVTQATRRLTLDISTFPGDLDRARRLASRLAAPIGTATALPVHHSAEYLAEVKAGGHRYALMIDTGSSDTWFVKDGFQCLISPHCNLGPAFKGEFPGGQIEVEHLNISYGGDVGAFLNGQMGYSEYEIFVLYPYTSQSNLPSLTVAGVTVAKQQIALATVGAWPGDGISSGILGLGLPALTNSFKSTHPSEDGLQSLAPYSPIITTLTNQIGKHIFSLGLSRNESESFLAFGGVPQHVKVGNYTRVPIEKMPKAFGGEDYFYYALTPEGMYWGSSSGMVEKKEGMPQVIVDSGTTLNVFSHEIAQSINARYDPPATYSKSLNGWFVPCNAVPPSFGIQIGGQIFWADASSMVLPQVIDVETGYCATGIGATDASLYILGDVFMQGIVAVFDVGQRMEMRFAKRSG